MFVDLNPLMAEDGVSLDDYFYPMDLEWGYEGGMYGAILYAGGQANYVNKDLVEAAGLEFPAEDWTWDDLLESAKAMTNPDENQSGINMTPLQPPYWSSSFIHGAGGTVLNDAKDQCTLTTPEAQAGLQFVADLILVHKVMPPPGAFDGQDNPFPNVQNMKFYEVMKQIVLTSHLVGYDLLTISLDAWNKLSPDQQAKVQKAADDAIAWSTAQHQKREDDLAAFFKEKGLKIYKPDVDAFRKHAQKMYLESDLAKDWPAGMVDRINAL